MQYLRISVLRRRSIPRYQRLGEVQDSYFGPPRLKGVCNTKSLTGQSRGGIHISSPQRRELKTHNQETLLERGIVFRPSKVKG